MSASATSADLLIREIRADEFHRLWPLFQAVIAPGDTYSYPPDLTMEQACEWWTTPPSRCFIAESNGEILGCYMLRPNQPGLGDHVANAGYMVSPAARGQGIAGILCEHSLQQAREAGFTAMQFNFVVSTNNSAVRVWQRHGFTIVGQVPGAFRHATLGPTDIYVMHRYL
ncbi:GNAT family N-acetyltransferase [Dyella monticola]|uniref:GNAT family N-acetyltransferase n=1 Tax=Dyella monticola TaxID=1927958 RepID=A0A370X801_9GAMM|nr:GNAT family N-acetyltransferase [Dyella monticola]RDS84543.1 GNAT family N-acetyltransferase [Dyella monticola]